MRILEDVAYGNLPEQRLNLCLPEGRARAALIYLHGGGLESGDRRGEECVRLSEDLARSGYATVLADYRMYPQARYPEFIEDCALAVAWTFAHAAEYGLGDQIFLGGSSAGAYLAGMLCFDRRYLAAQGLEPERLAGFVLDAGQPTTHFNVLREHGEDPRRCVVDEAAMLFHISDARPARPMLILYAEEDMPCRPEQNALLAATLKHMGYDQSLITVHEMKGFTHCGYDFVDDENGVNLLAGQVLAFLERCI